MMDDFFPAAVEREVILDVVAYAGEGDDGFWAPVALVPGVADVAVAAVVVDGGGV